jgi:copper(I)-binding protein
MTLNMNRLRVAAWARVGGAAALAMLVTLPLARAQAPQAPHGAPRIVVHDAWVRWLPNRLPAAGYMNLTNTSNQGVDLVSASSPDYGSVMLHRSVSNGSTQSMEMVDKLPIPAHGAVAVAPGGYHLMLEAPRHKIAPGDTVHVQLRFSNGETVDTPMPVKTPGAAAP